MLRREVALLGRVATCSAAAVGNACKPSVYCSAMRTKGLVSASALTAAVASASSWQRRWLSSASAGSTSAAAARSGGAKGLHIYTSKLPSVKNCIKNETSLYSYLMKRMAAADPKKIAVVQAETGKSLTYPELIAATELAAMALYAHGVRKHDVVSVCMLNTLYYGSLVYGTLRLGAVVSTLNAVAPASTLAYFLKANHSKVVLGIRFFQKQLEEAVATVQQETGHTITILYPDEFFEKPHFSPIPADYKGLEGASLDDTIALPFSSGTSGMPKGVQLSNRAIIACSEQSAMCSSVTDKDVTVAVLPLFHILGFTLCMTCIFAMCGTQVVMYKYTVEDYIKTCEKYKASFNMVAPPILISLLKNADKVKQHDLSSLRILVSGAAPLGPEVVNMVEKLLPGCTVGQGYGMTEMAPTVTSPPPRMQLTPGASGTLLPDTELRIVEVDESQQSGADKSAGIDVKPGEEGEVWVRGPQIMKGYLQDEDTVMCMQDGWYRTGDIGKMLATGELIITDRLKELIKYKGFQVSPVGLEAVLLSHPWVKDCVVIGVPDPRDVSFENPRALVVLREGIAVKDAVRASDELYRFIMLRMPPHKRLHGGVRIVDEIPRSAAGKILRRQVRSDETAFLKVME